MAPNNTLLMPTRFWILALWALIALNVIKDSAAFFSSLGVSRQQQRRKQIQWESRLSTTTGRHEGDIDSSSSHVRRAMLSQVVLTTGFLVPSLPLTTTSPSSASALDMDAFMNQELQPQSSLLSSDKKFSDDEALCKFGQPSKERGDACVRAGLPTTLKKGGVDAYGNVDRGNFVRCKIIYVEDPNSPNKGFLMKKTVCQ